MIVRTCDVASAFARWALHKVSCTIEPNVCMVVQAEWDEEEHPSQYILSGSKPEAAAGTSIHAHAALEACLLAVQVQHDLQSWHFPGQCEGLILGQHAAQLVPSALSVQHSLAWLVIQAGRQALHSGICYQAIATSMGNGNRPGQLALQLLHPCCLLTTHPTCRSCCGRPFHFCRS